MRKRARQLTMVIAVLVALYAATAACLYYTMPGPRRQFELMVIGTGSTGVAMFVFYLFCLVRSRRS